MIRTIKKVVLAGLLAISGIGLYGCASTASERPEAFTGQTQTSASNRGVHYEWSGKGLQWGRVVQN